MVNCTDDTHFSDPLPFVGIYISSATLLCVIAMLADLVHGIRNKQYWIPNRYFSLNAASIAILGVATKLSVDLTTPMPRQLDQLVKLGSSAFLAVVLANFIPSAAKLEKNEHLANTMGLAIVVITSVVNICIQLRTGVIHSFKLHHVFLLCSIFASLVDIFIFYPRWRSIRQSRYERKHERALRESLGFSDREKAVTEKLEEYLIKFTLMAHSGCPHFEYARSLRYCFAIWACIFSPASLFLFACLFRSSEGKNFESNSCESDYRWSVLGILITQIIFVGVALVFQSVRVVHICRVHLKASLLRDRESLERLNFWMHPLQDLKTYLFHSYIKYRHPMYIVLVKSLSLYGFLVINLHDIAIFASLIALWKILLHLHHSVSKNSDYDNQTASASHPDLNFIKLRPYVLYLKGEEQLIKVLMESASSVTHKYIDAGRKREPKHLVELLSNYMSRDFGGVFNFDRDELPSLSPEGSPPNCWTLPVVTLTSIAIALPDVDRNSIDKLIKSVKEGLLYVNIIEDNFSNKHDLINVKAAASVAWAGIDLRRRWLDVDLTKLALRNIGPIEIIESLSHFAKQKFPKMRMQSVPKAIAAHSMYTICQTLLEEYQNENNHQDRLSERIFENLCITISDILGACFTNIKRWILLECSKSSLEKRREAAYHILKFFGETEKIMKMVEQREIPNLSPNQMGFIEKWRHAFPRSLYHMVRRRARAALSFV